jgi:hypothetical protein
MENAEVAEVAQTTPQEARPIEERFADAMGLENDPTGQPEVQEPEAEVEQEAASEVAEDGDVAEIEYDGETYQVPKSLKDAFLRQQDYTRKTQEVAEHRKAVEAEKESLIKQQQFFQFQQTVQQNNMQHLAKLQQIDSTLKQFEGLDWNAVIDQDPVQALKLQQQYQSLQTQRQGTLQEYMSIQEQARQVSEQHQTEVLQRGFEQVKKVIPDYSPETQKQLWQTARGLGYTDQELAGITDPRLVIGLHKIAMYDKIMNSKPEVNRKVAQASPSMKIKAQAPKQSQSDVLKKVIRTSKDRQSKHNAIQKLMERMV